MGGDHYVAVCSCSRASGLACFAERTSANFGPRARDEAEAIKKRLRCAGVCAALLLDCARAEAVLVLPGLLDQRRVDEGGKPRLGQRSPAQPRDGETATTATATALSPRSTAMADADVFEYIRKVALPVPLVWQKRYESCWGHPAAARTDGVLHLAHSFAVNERFPLYIRPEYQHVHQGLLERLEEEEKAVVLAGQPGIGPLFLEPCSQS